MNIEQKAKEHFIENHYKDFESTEDINLDDTEFTNEEVIQFAISFALSLQIEVRDEEIEKKLKHLLAETYNSGTIKGEDGHNLYKDFKSIYKDMNIDIKDFIEWLRSKFANDTNVTSKTDSWVSVEKIEERIQQYKNVYKVLKANYQKNKNKATEELMDNYIEIMEALESLLPNPPKEVE